MQQPTSDWKAGCGKPARPVWREGRRGQRAVPTPIYDIVSQGSGDSERNSKDQYGVHIDADSPGNGPDGIELPFLLKLSPAAPDNYVLERVLLLDFNGQVLLDAQNSN